MKKDLKFNTTNRGLLEEEMGLVDIVNASLKASAARHGVTLKREYIITAKITSRNGKTVRRVSAQGKDPVEVLLAAS